MIPGSMIATGSYALWDRLSDVGDWVVVLFGLLLWASCVFSLFCLGVRAMSTRRYKQAKHKRLPRVQTTRSNPAIAWRLISRVVAGPMRRLFPTARVRARSRISATEGGPHATSQSEDLGEPADGSVVGTKENLSVGGSLSGVFRPGGRCGRTRADDG
jgi:hypothetical protein